jgi:tRNA G37 N-methylase TrmD
MLLVLVMEMNLVNIEKYGTEKYKWVDDELVGHGGDGIKRWPWTCQHVFMES